MTLISSLRWTKEHLLSRTYQKILVLVLLVLLVLLSVGGGYSSRVILLVLRSEMVFSHLFYLPVALAGLWWGLRGVWVALLIGTAWIASYYLSGLNVPPQEYFPQPVMFILVGLTVGVLRQQTLHSERNLRNRVKQLDCLFATSTLQEKQGLSIEALISAAVTLLPPAWQYPDITAARVVIENHSAETPTFATTPWSLTSNIMVYNRCVGQVEVCYLEAMPPAYEGPFLREERRLIDAVAGRLGRIIERDQAEVALRKSEMTNRALVNAIPDIIWRINGQGTLLDCTGTQAFSRSVRDDIIVGKPLTELLPADIAQQAIEYVEQTRRTGSMQMYEYELINKGILHAYEARLVVSGENEVLGIVRDISDRKARESLVEEERLRIARDLHDGLAQSLYFLGIKLDYLRKQVRYNPDGVIEELLTLKRIVQASIQDVRRTIFALRPVDLEGPGFATALRQYTLDFGEHMGLHVTLDIQGDPTYLPAQLEPVFFRLIQESLNNIAKHASARNVWITLYIHVGHTAQLIIHDDGIGFDAETLSTNGSKKLGLNQMHDRVAQVGGQFAIESQPNQGTTIRASIPL